MAQPKANPFTDGEEAPLSEEVLTPRIRLADVNAETGEAAVDIEMVDEQGNVVYTINRASLRIGQSVLIKSIQIDVTVKEKP